MTNLKPIGDKVLVKPSEQKEVTKSGIVLPGTADEKPNEGEILAVGTGKLVGDHIVPLGVKVGQRVLFSKYGPVEVKVDGEELYILSEADIYGVFE